LTVSLVKFLLAAGEPDSPGKPMKIPSLNKRLNQSLNQEVLERLYERLMRIINLPVDDYLENEDYAKEIESYNESSIAVKSEKENSVKIEENDKKEMQTENIENGVSEQKETKKGDMEEEQETKLETEQDDLICDEVLLIKNEKLMRIGS